MGRKSLGELPTVLTTVRVAGEHAAKLMAGGKKLGEAIRELIEREFSGAAVVKQQVFIPARQQGKSRQMTIDTIGVDPVGSIPVEAHEVVEPAGEARIISENESGPKRGHCVHGNKRGEHCWQCGGLAKIGGAEPEEPKKKGFKR
jgi:hypothetical protein